MSMDIHKSVIQSVIYSELALEGSTLGLRSEAWRAWRPTGRDVLIFIRRGVNCSPFRCPMMKYVVIKKLIVVVRSHESNKYKLG